METNYDLWDNPPADDDRRDPAIKAMNAIGQANITADTLVEVKTSYYSTLKLIYINDNLILLKRDYVILYVYILIKIHTGGTIILSIA